MLVKSEGGRRRGWQRMKWLDGILTQWTWVWASSGSWRWTGKPGVLQSMGSQRVDEWATELNWTELNALFNMVSILLYVPEIECQWFCLEASRAGNKTVFAEHAYSPEWSAGAPMLDTPRPWSCKYESTERIKWNCWTLRYPTPLPSSRRRTTKCFLLTSSLWEAELDSGELGTQRIRIFLRFKGSEGEKPVGCLGKPEFPPMAGRWRCLKGYAEEGNIMRASLQRCCS